MVRYKARLVALGYMQQLGIDFDGHEIYSCVLKLKSLRIVLSISIQIENINYSNWDISNAFISASLEKPVFMRQPPGYVVGDKVCKLIKALYGLKSAPRLFGDLLSSVLVKIGLTKSTCDESVYFMTS